jgi:predicted amidohydrolase
MPHEDDGTGIMKLKTACIQLSSGSDMAANIARIEALVAEAAAQGAQLAALPENAFLMDEPGAQRQRYTQENHPGIRAAAALAQRHSLWLLVGSAAIYPPEGDKAYNRSLLFNPQGEITAHYDKIHLFDVEVGDGQSYRESAKILSGSKTVLAQLPEGILGMTICYDVRFPHLYRALAKAGADILAVPSAFTQVTGEAHWHVLLRARAIENGCFVIAPAQCGTHPGGRKTYGHSLIIDPWGRVLADGGTQEGIIACELDLAHVRNTRAKLPSLQHDRAFE